MRPIVAILLLTLAATAVGQTTYRWLDKEGKVHYSDRPPAAGEAAKVEQKRASALGADQTASHALRKAMADYPVTLYSQDNCGDVCAKGRDHLTRRGVPFAEKPVASEDDVKRLRTLVGGTGELVVPVLQVGSKAAKGYLGSDWDGLLDAAGYPKSPSR